MWVVINIFLLILPNSGPDLLCQANTSSTENVEFRMPYDLSTYDELLNLPPSLTEISGLSYDPDQKLLLAVNDEQGIIHFIDPNDGNVVETIKFGSSGDYEGLTWAGRKVYIAKSNGNIYVYDLDKKMVGERIKTDLKSGNDVEGLSYCRDHNGLVIACKGRAQIEKEDKTKGTKALYLYDLESMKMGHDPYIWVDDDYLTLCMQEQDIYLESSRRGREKLVKRARDFSPSGVAHHPVTSDLYLISSVGKMLVVLSREGDVLYIQPLDDRFHRQPEGICFDDQGNLYIANEGRGLVAKIYKYQPNN